MSSLLSKDEIHNIFNDMDNSCDLDSKIESLRKLIQHVHQDNEAHPEKDYFNQDHEIIRKLVDRWVMWIALNDDALQPQIDAFSRELRTEPDAVHALVDYFAYPLNLTYELKCKIVKDAVEPVYLPFVKYYRADLLGYQSPIGPSQSGIRPDLDSDDPSVAPAKKKNLDQLLTSLAEQRLEAGRASAYEELYTQPMLAKIDPQTYLNKILEVLFEEERLRREKLVYQRVTSQLAHMSDPRFYGSDEKKYNLVHSLLEKHAAPVIVFNLPKHTDLETRWHVGLLLGYVGGRLAIDGLVTALIDEKSTRDARQKILSEYYLEPAKRQSQQAAEILKEAIEDARFTMLWLRYLNIGIIAIGMVMILSAIYLAAFPREITRGDWRQYSGFITLAGGVGTILLHFFANPLNRIQNSINNLVQMETAFTNFIWELNLNGAYIQSRYVAGGKLTDFEVSQTIQRMERSLTKILKPVDKNTQAADYGKLPRIHRIKPATGKSGDVVEVHGKNLIGDLADQEDIIGMLAINHIPCDVDGLKWEKHKVSFKIPGLKEGGVILISLIVDGNETNALPFFLET